MVNENKKWTYAAEALDFVREKERLGQTDDPLYAEALAMVNANQGTKEAYEVYRKEAEKQNADLKAERESEKRRQQAEQDAVAQAKAEAEQKARADAIAASKMTNAEAFQIVFSVVNGASHPRYEEALAQVQANHATNQAYQDLIEQKEKQKREAEAALRAKEEREKAAVAAKNEVKKPQAADASGEDASLQAVESDVKTNAGTKVVAPKAASDKAGKKEGADLEEMTPEKALFLLETEGMAHPDYHSLLRLVRDNPAIFVRYQRFLKEKQESAHREKEDVSWVNAVILNREDMQRYAKDYYPSSYAVQRKGYVNKIIDRVDIYETHSETGEQVVLDEARKKDCLNMLFEKSKLEAFAVLLEDEQYMRMSDKDKKEKFRSDVDDRFFANVAQVTMSSSVVAPEGKELEIGSPEQLSYVKRLSAQFQDKLAKVINTDERLKLNLDHVLVSVADTADKIEDYCADLKQRAKQVKNKLTTKGAEKLRNAIDYVANKKTRLEDRANKISNGKYKKIAQIFRENKFKIASNAIATGALALSGYGTVALVAYGLYMAADAWISPVVNEAQKIKDQRKEANMVPISFRERWHEARAKLKNDGKYKRKAITTSAIAALSFGALAYAAPALQAADGIRKGFVLARMGISNMAQATETGYTGLNALRHKGDEIAQKEFKSAAKGLGIGVVVSGASLGLRALAENVDLEDIKKYFGDVKEWAKGLFHRDHGVSEEIVRTSTGGDGKLWYDPQLMQDGTGVAPEGSAAPVEDVDLQPEVEIERFPTAWNEKLGIDEKRFNIWRTRINNGKIADFDAQSLDRAYMNMNNDFVSHFVDKSRLHEMLEKGIISQEVYDNTANLDAFPSRWSESMGISKEEYDTIMSNTRFRTLYDYTEIMRNGRRHQDVLGNAEHGFYINTPTGRQPITDEGIIAQAKAALENGDRLLVTRLHGRAFLREQFENMHIDGMTDEKMNKAIEIAMHTFDGNQVKGATGEISSLFENLSSKQVQTISKIVDYNREFEQYGEAMTQMKDALCDKTDGMQYDKVGNLLHDRAPILARSNGL